MAKYKSPYLLPDEHMRLVGIIAAHWESLDLILQQAVAECMGMQFGDVRLLTENLSTNAKFDLITGHARKRPTAEFKAINRALGYVRDAYGVRNTYVHAKWHVEPGSKLVWRLSVRTKGGRIAIVQTLAHPREMEDAAEQVVRATSLLIATLEKYGLLQASP